MMMNQGALFAMSSKQKLNTQSSTEAELVGVNDDDNDPLDEAVY